MANLRLRVAPQANLRVKSYPVFPTAVEGASGIQVSKSNGIWTVEPKWDDLGLIDSDADVTNKQVWTYDSETGVYNRVRLPLAYAGAVRFDEAQSLDDDEKLQARENIGAAHQTLETVAGVEAATLDAGMGGVAHLGYHEAADGGGAVRGLVTGSFPSPGVIQNTDGALLKLARNGLLSVKQTGAVGDFNTGTQTGTDDYAAFEEAYNFVKEVLASGGPGYSQILVPSGNYRLSEPFNMSTFGAQLIGEGAVASKIYADHADGYAVRLQRSRSSVKGLTIGATTDRATYAGGDALEQTGLHLEAPSGVSQTAFTLLDDLIIENHTGHGLLGICSGLSARGIEARDCGGHGIVFDTGNIISSPDTLFQGWIDLTNFRCSNNGGHGLAIGHPDDGGAAAMYRVRARNGDIGGNCLDAAVKYQDEQVFVNANGATLEDCGVSGASFFVSGTNIVLDQNRHPTATLCVRVGTYPSGLGCDNIRISNMLQVGSTLSGAAVIVDPAITGRVTIDQPITANISTLFTGPVSRWRFAKQEAMIGGNLTVDALRSVPQFAIGDDKVAIINLQQAFTGVFMVWCTVSQGRSGLFHVGTAASLCALIARTNSDMAVTTGALTGTTGIDGNITISADSSNNLYIENRNGSSRSFSFQLFGGNSNPGITSITISP